MPIHLGPLFNQSMRSFCKDQTDQVIDHLGFVNQVPCCTTPSHALVCSSTRLPIAPQPPLHLGRVHLGYPYPPGRSQSHRRLHYWQCGLVWSSWVVAPSSFVDCIGRESERWSVRISELWIPAWDRWTCCRGPAGNMLRRRYRVVGNTGQSRAVGTRGEAISVVSLVNTRIYMYICIKTTLKYRKKEAG